MLRKFKENIRETLSVIVHLIKYFAVISIPLTFAIVNGFAMALIFLPYHWGLYTYVGIAAVNMPWFVPWCYVMYKRSVNYTKGLLSENKFSINWDAKRAAEEYIALIKKQSERFKEESA